jgi:hypothetical protein
MSMNRRGLFDIIWFQGRKGGNKRDDGAFQGEMPCLLTLYDSVRPFAVV